jgi:hypothetical protein
MYYLRYKDIQIKTNQVTLQPIACHSTIKGEVRFIVRNQDGRVDQDTGWFPNLLTDRGLADMGNGFAAFGQCHLGTSNQTPAYTDTTLYGWLGNAGFANAVETKFPTAPNYEFAVTQSARFAAGECTGTIREVGMRKDTTNANMAVRALVSPEVTKGATQVLDVYYTITQYPQITDSTGVVNIDGTDYNYILRLAECNEAGGLQPRYNPWRAIGFSNQMNSFTGDIGTILQEPTGFLAWSGNKIYVGNGSGYRDEKYVWGLDSSNGWNRSFRTWNNQVSVGCQAGSQLRLGKVSDDTALLKANTQEISCTLRNSFSRHP